MKKTGKIKKIKKNITLKLKNTKLFLKRGGKKNHIIKYKDGSNYIGEVNEDYFPNGIGKMEYNNGDIYNGNWSQNKKQGKGEMIYKNGDKYKGNWKNDVKHGEGIMKYSNGQIYDGIWWNDFYEDIFFHETIASFDIKGQKHKRSYFDIDCE